jgi:hypothetical protein
MFVTWRNNGMTGMNQNHHGNQDGTPETLWGSGFLRNSVNLLLSPKMFPMPACPQPLLKEV